jgi:hypothetical protein
MRDLMELLCDYLTLEDKITRGVRLTAGQQARWLTLHNALPGTGSAPGPGPAKERVEDGALVELTANGRFEAARLMGVSRDGLRVRIQQPLRLGTQTLVRVIAEGPRTEYVYPCVVAWCDGHVMGMCFDGRPVRGLLVRSAAADWQCPLNLQTGWGVRAESARA